MKGRQPLYLGIFSEDPKAAAKEIKYICQQSIKLVAEKEEELSKEVGSDLSNFEGFSPPQGNPHITSLFIGGKVEKLNQKQKQIFKTFPQNEKKLIKIDFIVYVPNYLMVGFCSDTDGVYCHNQFPHITLLLKNKAKPVESNDILKTLFEHAPQILKERNFQVKKFQVKYGESESIYVINKGLQLKGLTGNDITHGKK